MVGVVQQSRSSRCGELVQVLGKDFDGIYRCVAQGPGPASAPRGSFRLSCNHPALPIFQARGISSWGGSFLYLLPQHGQNCLHPPKHGNYSSLKPSPNRAASPLPPWWPPCTSYAHDDLLPRCCLCWREGTEARDRRDTERE